MTRFLSLALALIMALTSQSMAAAKGMTHDVAGQVVLCTGDGLRTIQIDRDGNPIEVVHICPDCALFSVETTEGPQGLPVAVVHMQTLGQAPVVEWRTGLIHISPAARGPPAFV